MMSTTRQHAGFTLVEAVITLVVLGVLAGVVAVFIRAPVQNYADSAARAEMSDAADYALRRIARDLRSALPNSIRVAGDGHAIEFMPTKTGGRYLAASDGDTDPTHFPLEFVNAANPNKNFFTVLGPLPTFVNRAQANDYVVVYNLGSGFSPADAWTASPTAGTNIAQIKAVTAAADGTVKVELKNNVFVSQTPAMTSPNQRFMVVGQPVSYYCGAENGVLTLRRYWGYGFNPSLGNAAPSGGSSAVVATRLDSCGLFGYDGSLSASGNAATRRSGLVTLTMALRPRNQQAAAIRLVYQVHVDNTP